MKATFHYLYPFLEETVWVILCHAVRSKGDEYQKYISNKDPGLKVVSVEEYYHMVFIGLRRRMPRIQSVIPHSLLSWMGLLCPSIGPMPHTHTHTHTHTSPLLPEPKLEFI